MRRVLLAAVVFLFTINIVQSRTVTISTGLRIPAANGVRSDNYSNSSTALGGHSKALAAESEALLPLTVGIPPVVANYSPQFGPSGTILTIHGTGFGSTQGTSSVSIQSAVTGILSTWATTSWSDTEIVVPVPTSVPSGKVYLSVIVGGVQSIGAYTFTVGIPPLVTNYSPQFGPSGTILTIHGTGFGSVQGTSSVSIQSAVTGILSTWAPTSWSDTEIVVSVPRFVLSGKVYLSVTVRGLQSIGVYPFTVGTPPVTTSYSPESGPPGTKVTIKGTGFGSTQGASSVSIQSAVTGSWTEWKPTSWSDTEIVAPVPDTMPNGLGYLMVTADGLQSIGVCPFTVGIPPVISSYSPQFGPPGTDIIVHGTGFGPTQGNSSVYILSAVTGTWTTWTPKNWSDAEITVSVPSSMPTGKVYLFVEVDELRSLSWHPFTVGVPALVGSYSPASGSPGTVLTIRGAGFGLTQGSSYVSVQPAETDSSITWPTTSWSDTEIVVPVPTSMPSGKVYLSVTVGALKSIGVYPFTVGIPPLVTNYSPQFGPAGTIMTIHGTGFGSTQGTNSVSIQSAVTGTWSTWTPTSWNDTEIVVPVPTSVPSGKVYLSVTVGGLQSIGVYPFTVGIPPTITASSPNFGSPATVVTIHGTGFGAMQGNSNISVQSALTGTWNTWTPTSWSDTEIVVPVPISMPRGTVYFSVTVDRLQSIGMFAYDVQ